MFLVLDVNSYSQNDPIDIFWLLYQFVKRHVILIDREVCCFLVIA